MSKTVEQRLDVLPSLDERSSEHWIVCPDTIDHTISHSGQTWTTHKLVWPNSSPQGRDPVPLWPVSEFLARTKHTFKQAQVLNLLNPDGVPEGEYPIGWKSR